MTGSLLIDGGAPRELNVLQLMSFTLGLADSSLFHGSTMRKAK